MIIKFSRFEKETYHWFQVLWLFLFFNGISFVSAPSLTTTRLSFIFLVGLVVLSVNKVRLDKSALWIILCSISLGFLSAVISVSSLGDLTQFSRFLHFAIFSILSAYLFTDVFKNEKAFHLAVVKATLIQVFFVILTYSSSEANEIIFRFVLTGHNFLENLARAPGLSSSGGATLSVILSFGALSVTRLSIMEKKPWHLTALIVILLSQVLVGRTGLIISIIALLLYLINNGLGIRALLSVSLTILVSFNFVADALMKNEQFVSYTVKWAVSSLTGEDGTFNALLAMSMKKVDLIAALFGTGQVTTPEGLNTSGSDVGYVQTFYAAGVLGLFFYIALFLFLFEKYIKFQANLYFTFLLFLPFLIEIKEPFIFKYMVFFFVLTSFLYRIRAQSNDV